MMVIAPIVVLAVGGFVVFLIALTSGSLRLREKNAMVYDIQNALNNIESDASYALAFTRTTVAGPYPIQAPQGSNNGAAAYTVSAGNNTLLIKAPATTTNPAAGSQGLVYLATPDATCAAPTLNANDPFFVLYAYSVRSGSLWRRTILSTTAAGLCNGPAWQLPSCAQSSIPLYPAICKAADVNLLDNVSSMAVSYYRYASDTTPISSYSWTDDTSPQAISVVLSASKSVAGVTISNSGTLRVTSTNIHN